VRLCLRKE